MLGSAIFTLEEEAKKWLNTLIDFLIIFFIAFFTEMLLSGLSFDAAIKAFMIAMLAALSFLAANRGLAYTRKT